MRDVAVAGVGMVPFVRRSDVRSVELGAQALRAALSDAGVDWGDVDRVVVGSVGGGFADAPRLLHRFPRTGVGAFAVENASATGSSALAAAYEAVADSRCNVAAAVGFGSLERLLAAGVPGRSTPDLAALSGANLPPVVFALMQNRRMHMHGEGVEAAARVAVKNHANAVRNPDAQRRKDVSLDDVLESPMIADPLRRLECCPWATAGPRSSSPPPMRRMTPAAWRCAHR